MLYWALTSWEWTVISAAPHGQMCKTYKDSEIKCKNWNQTELLHSDKWIYCWNYVYAKSSIWYKHLKVTSDIKLKEKKYIHMYMSDAFNCNDFRQWKKYWNDVRIANYCITVNRIRVENAAWDSEWHHTIVRNQKDIIILPVMMVQIKTSQITRHM